MMLLAGPTAKMMIIAFAFFGADSAEDDALDVFM